MVVDLPVEVHFRRNSKIHKVKTTDNRLMYVDYVNDLEDTCRRIAQQFLSVTKFNNCSPSLISTSAHLCDPDFTQPDWMNELLDSNRAELENVITSSIKVTPQQKNPKHLWDSFILRDAEEMIQSLRENYLRSIAKPIDATQPVRLGRVYAWAREQGGENHETENLSRKRMLQRRLSRLVRLTRAGKRSTRSHPLLISLRHQLLRIRTRCSTKLCSEHTAAMRLSTLWNSDYSYRPKLVENVSESLKRIVPSGFHTAFTNLIDKLAISFAEISSHAPGLPTSDCVGLDDATAYWRNVATKTVLDFYLQLDDLDSTIPPDSSDLDVELMSVDAMDSSESEAEFSTDPSTNVVGFDPALVQATLDRFDHVKKRTNRKRRSETYDDNLIVSDLLNASPEKPFKPSSLNQGSLDAVLHSETLTSTSETNQTDGSAVVSNAEQGEPMSIDIVCPPDNPVVSAPTGPSTDESAITESNKTTESQKATKRKSRRSLRRRSSRTPSENSFSEGEVLSDSEEERANAVKDTAESLTELNEKFSADIEEEEAEELIRMVNEQFADTTPADDIDLTELEIMDEWALPSRDAAAANELKGSTETNGKQVILPEETEKKIRAVIDEALSCCANELEKVITRNMEVNAMDPPAEKISTENVCSISNETEASIARTVCAFKEHVSSVLTNLLHALPVKGENEQTKRTPAVPVTAPRRTVGGRKQSRLLGMLRSYQQDVVRRSNTTTTA